MFVFLKAATATPVFNHVNLFDVNGNLCPVTPKLNVTCPVLCVSDLSFCPNLVKPQCPQDQVYCVDGACRTECPVDLVNPCSCGIQSSKLSTNVLSLVPCLTQPNVNITQYNPSSPRSIQSVCASNLGITSPPLWSKKFSGDIAWINCPTTSKPMTFIEPVYIALYSIVGAEMLILLLWKMYKSSLEKKVKPVSKANTYHSPSNSINGASSSSQSLENDKSKTYIPKLDSTGCIDKKKATLMPSVPYSIPNSPDLSITEYSFSFIGTCAFYTLMLTTLSYFGFFLLLTLDYYEVLAPGGAKLFGGNYLYLGRTFIILWCFVTLWVVALSVIRNDILNFFRIKTHFGQGDIVKVSQPEEIIVLEKSESSSVVELFQRIGNNFKKAIGADKSTSNCIIKKTSQHRKYFEFLSTRYVYQSEKYVYETMEFDIGKSGQEIYQSSSGLSQAEAEFRSEILGLNFISVEVPTFFKSLGKEFSSFFYIYQFMILLLFYYYSYYQIGIADTLVILVSTFIKVFINLKSEKRLKKLAEFSSDCLISRDGRFVTENTKNIVVGDLVAIELGQVISFDGVLVSGEIIVDESSLTGEAMPIRKIPLPIDTEYFDGRKTSKMSSILSGTTVLQTSSSDPLHETNSTTGIYATALVTKIGTSTEKGNMISKILNPTKILFIFNKQIRVVMFVLFIQGLFWLSFAIWLLKASAIAGWFSGVFSLAQLISPLLPASLVIGQSIAVQRLKKKQIYCIDIPRVMVAGKIEIFCFDKTGTLTKEGLEFDGISEIKKPQGNNETPSKDSNISSEDNRTDLSLSKLENDISKISLISSIGLGCCHSVSMLGDTFIGNPVDIEMFKSSGWSLGNTKEGFIQSMYNSPNKAITNSDNEPNGIHIIKRNDFVHHRMSMSVVAFDERSGETIVFVKGSFERIFELCNKKSLPHNYIEFAKSLARKGNYVLALAYKNHGKIGLDSLVNLGQDEIESDLEFSCLIVFKNNLKPDTKAALAQIKSSNTRNVMITGDTTLTGVFIARECGMIEDGKRVIIGDLDKNRNIEFLDIDNNEIVNIYNTGEKSSLNLDYSNLEIAVTSAAYEKMVSDGTISSFLPHIRVFGRMTPQNKVSCINYHMKLGVTAMCGDGGNDCGALRAAHVGIALSNSEASIVSPFSSSNKSIFTCVNLMSQTRGALATSLANYKYLILYGQTMASFKVLNMYFSIANPQTLWIFIDAFVTVGMSVAISMSKPIKKLSKFRPTAKILGAQTLTSTLGQVFINWFFNIITITWLFRQSWFRCHEFDSSTSDLAKWWLLGDNFEGEICALLVLFQFVNVGFIYNFGHTFRQRWYKNYFLVSLWVVFISLISYVELADPNYLGCALRINCGDPDVLVSLGYKRPSFYIEKYNTPLGHNVLTKSARYSLWAINLSNMAVGILWELVVVIGPVGRYFSNKKSKAIKPKYKL
ncbi:putative cation-transporting ATPase 13A2 [Smittium culicis]|uniref:Putative cation-transporting ATPase 13A2 n=2 Tax=Smittium culicis TaxID=133412 RepID=A0A1R1YGT6_9FUNG|nr:putative cation-transporting ATPase 13A2 [Smittium culicis]